MMLCILLQQKPELLRKTVLPRSLQERPVLNSFPPFLLLCAGGGKNFFHKTKLVTVTKTLTLRRSAATITRHLRREDGRKLDNFTNQKRK
jgi:hypothetical protein